MKGQILYFFDPLCGWCYGFGQTMEDFYHQHKAQHDFEAIAGGMVTNERIAPYHTMADYITGVKPQLEQTTGQPISDAYEKNLLHSKILMDSVPPSKALVVYKKLQAEGSIAFAHALQRMHFSEGKDYNDLGNYVQLAEDFELDGEEFLALMQAEATADAVSQEFAWTQQVGIQGFPTVVIGFDRDFYLLSRGYAPTDVLNENMKRALEAHTNKST
ncbi:DsbA family protein [Marinoscillum furvescens]|uniref:DSBA-like thioredoxin domain-containing protein n=1 Tax=Marinoscillum furvescens DSM 4134 TaxID=1122208 RepID=A0A3D9KXI0_MARFU|nr:DsbA family protein [Marinoscillum furvescens]RED93647.1 putative protein-disulfide isomerase [Marinoscillum furvescens DSM 4134]